MFSPDEENGKVAHVNYLPKEVLERKVLDAKVWLGEVSKVLGGKVGHCYLDSILRLWRPAPPIIP